jgi:hypothetical protein
LGDADDLETFLFSTSRQSLSLLGEGLRRIDGVNCFYCGHGMSTFDVDHFVPFSQYPKDLAHNFVLAHPGCNRSKSDMLAGRPHLERWLERLVRRADAVAEVGLHAGIVVEADVSRRVATWGYTSAAASGSKAWLEPTKFEVIDGSYLRCFEDVP